MTKSKYTEHIHEILEMQASAKTALEIAELLNTKHIGFGATESAVRGAIKRHHDKDTQEQDLEAVSDPREKTKHLSGLLEEMEKKNSFMQKEAVVQGKLLNNLENKKIEYEEIIEKYSILNDTFHETIIQTKEDNSRRKLYYMISAGWILTMLFAMFAGYYIGRCYSRPAFHYILTLTGIPAGVLIGIGLTIAKKKINIQDGMSFVKRFSHIFYHKTFY